MKFALNLSLIEGISEKKAKKYNTFRRLESIVAVGVENISDFYDIISNFDHRDFVKESLNLYYIGTWDVNDVCLVALQPYGLVDLENKNEDFEYFTYRHLNQGKLKENISPLIKEYPEGDYARAGENPILSSKVCNLLKISDNDKIPVFKSNQLCQWFSIKTKYNNYLCSVSADIRPIKDINGIEFYRTLGMWFARCPDLGFSYGFDNLNTGSKGINKTLLVSTQVYQNLKKNKCKCVYEPVFSETSKLYEDVNDLLQYWRAKFI